MVVSGSTRLVGLVLVGSTCENGMMGDSGLSGTSRLRNVEGDEEQ